MNTSRLSPIVLAPLPVTGQLLHRPKQAVTIINTQNNNEIDMEPPCAQSLPMSLFVSITPDPVSLVLGTGYHRFKAINGLEGLAKVRDHRLDILAVVNDTGRPGLFRQFIRQAKVVFLTICVWAIENPAVYEALIRYGFTPETEIGFDGVPLHGLRWG